jgi:ATP-dependent DNA ligase
MINAIFEKLAATSSRNEKVEILKSHQSDELFIRVLSLALDPFVNFYIRKIPEYTPAAPETAWNLRDALDSLKFITTRRVTGNAAIEHLTTILSHLNAADAKVFERIIEKDLKCGVQESTVNKVWKGLIPSYPCMLCSPYEYKAVSKITYPAFFQLKMDGMRFNAIVRGGTVEFRSRNGKELDFRGNLVEEFLQLANGRDIVFDGELLVVGDDGEPLSRQIGNGILVKAQKGTLSDAEAVRVQATLWDEIPFTEFLTGKSTAKYLKRWESLTLNLERIGAQTFLSGETRNHKLHPVYSAIVHNLDEARLIFEEFLANGQEGGILKEFAGLWEDKRVKTQIKFKGENECDLFCTGWVEGTGKYAGMMGALELESSDGVIKVSVGTGFSDDDRRRIGKEVIGKVIAIKYNARIVDAKTGQESLFLPVFVEIREDKNYADSSKVIK